MSPPEPVNSRPSDPNEVIVGPSGISNRYKLRNIQRQKGSEQDVLVISLHVESLASESLVSPFESDMLEIHSSGMPPVKPSMPFRSPVPSGNSQDREVVFRVPPTLSLDRATSRIHYYNYEKEIPLNALRP